MPKIDAPIFLILYIFPINLIIGKLEHKNPLFFFHLESAQKCLHKTSKNSLWCLNYRSKSTLRKTVKSNSRLQNEMKCQCFFSTCLAMQLL